MFEINSKSISILFQFFKFFHSFCPKKCATYSCAYAYLKVYRGANPLACGSAITYFRGTNSQKWMLMSDFLNFFKKNSSNFPNSSVVAGVSMADCFVLPSAKYEHTLFHTCSRRQTVNLVTAGETER